MPTNSLAPNVFVPSWLISVALLIAACGIPQSSQERRWEMRRETVRIDESVIERGDISTIVKPMWFTAETGRSLQDYDRSMARFSLPQRLLFAVNRYRSELANGGHWQFYVNSWDVVWPEAAAGFEALDLPDAAEIVRESASRFGDRPRPVEWWEQERERERLKPLFRDLDDRAFAIEAAVDIQTKILEWIRSRRNDFLFDGTIERAVLPGVLE